MARSDPLQGITTPLGTETADGAANFAATVDQIVPKLNMRFATTTARDAAITPAGARKAGMMAWIDALGYWTTVLEDGGPWWQYARRDVFIGGEGLMAGTTPPVGTLKLRQEATIVTVPSGSGGVSLPFPTPFPVGLVSCVVTPGDQSADFAFAKCIIANTTLSQWNGIVYTHTGAVITTGGIRCNLFAVGW